MIVDSNPWSACATQVVALSHQEHDGSPPVTSERVLGALKTLVWLCGEGVVSPHSVHRGASGTVLFSWRQAGNWFEVEVAGPLNIEWRAGTKNGLAQSGGRLVRDVAELLKSVIPLSSRHHAPRPNGHSLG
jgi:hypothetical protein